MNPFVMSMQTQFIEERKRAALEEKLKQASNIEFASASFTATTIEGAIEELFTFVSNGKTVIASAITDKGITASGSETFSELAVKISMIEGGGGTGSYDTGFTEGYNIGYEDGYIDGQATNAGDEMIAMETPGNFRMDYTEFKDKGIVHTSWNPVIKNTNMLLGYNIFVDNRKHNTEPITGTSYTITGLLEKKLYAISVTSVTKMNVNSALSESIPVFVNSFVFKEEIFEMPTREAVDVMIEVPVQAGESDTFTLALSNVATRETVSVQLQ